MKNEDQLTICWRVGQGILSGGWQTGISKYPQSFLPWGHPYTEPSLWQEKKWVFELSFQYDIWYETKSHTSMKYIIPVGYGIWIKNSLIKLSVTVMLTFYFNNRPSQLSGLWDLWFRLSRNRSCKNFFQWSICPFSG